MAGARTKHWKAWTECQQLIQDGLSKFIYGVFGMYFDVPPAEILRDKGALHPSTQMNYAQYEQKIVESFGVALDGWPFDGGVCNPGGLGCNDLETLRDALEHKVCKWTKLSSEELLVWWIYNQQCTANSKQARPLHEQQLVSTGSGSNGSDGDAVGVDGDAAWGLSWLDCNLPLHNSIYSYNNNHLFATSQGLIVVYTC